jgi:REP-associated tyrosine transposase
VPQLQRHYGENHLHYLTTSTYRRARVFDSERFKRHFVAALAELRSELGFRILGYVLMPEHFHLLIWPSAEANPSQIMQKLKGRTARFILKTLRQNRQHAWCARMMSRFALPGTVHDEASCRVWQRRFYDMNVWSEKKRLEKLNYMHNNPVKRRLVNAPGEWPWSSWRYYYLQEASIIAMDRME